MARIEKLANRTNLVSGLCPSDRRTSPLSGVSAIPLFPAPPASLAKLDGALTIIWRDKTLIITEILPQKEAERLLTNADLCDILIDA
jgi:hypothetical protein